MLDVFHHLYYPVWFLREAMLVLRPGGRLVMIEPNVSPVSRLLFKLLHEEPVLLSEAPIDLTQAGALRLMKVTRQFLIWSSFIKHRN